MEMSLFNIFKTTNVTKPTKAILESSYIVLQGTSKQKTLKQTAYFLNTIEFRATFDIQIDIIFKKAHKGLSKHAYIHINKSTHYIEHDSLKQDALFFKIKTDKILNF